MMRILFVATLALLWGCDTRVEPFQESGYHFSFGGVIDASLDTQFVRVNPLREQATVPREPYDVVVSSINLESGEQAVWRDSVFVLQGGTFAHNFWTTERFQVGGTYRFEARWPDGREAYAEVVMPDSAQVVVQTIPFDPVATVNVLGAEKLADLKILYCGRLPGTPLDRISVSLIEQVSKFSGGYTVRVNPFALAEERGIESVQWIRVVAISAGSEWPDFAGVDQETLALPRVYSNVEYGVGYLGAVASTTISWPGFAPQDPACRNLLSRW